MRRIRIRFRTTRIVRLILDKIFVEKLPEDVAFGVGRINDNHSSRKMRDGF